MRLPFSTRRLALALALVLVGCAGSHASGTTGKPLHQFPSRLELKQIASAPRGNVPLAPGLASIDQWQVDAQAAAFSGAADAPYVAETPWDKLLDEEAAGTDAISTGAMRCLAQELSRVYLLNGLPPDQGLHRFLAGRCGALVSQADTLVWKPDVPESINTQVAFAQLAAGLRSELGNFLKDPGVQVGFGLSRAAGKMVMVVAKAKPAVQLQGFSRLVDAQSEIVLRGRLLKPASELMAYVNDGAYGVRPCKIDEALPLPEFRVRCAVSATDDHAWIQVSALPPGRVLSTMALSVLALRAPDAARTYTRRTFAAARPVGDDLSFRAAVIELVNGVRAQAGMQPVQGAVQQSQAVASLVTPFFDAMLRDGKDAGDLVDRISLGLMAGWAVQSGMIRNATLVTGVDVATPDAARWLSDALELPWGRLVLLDAEAKTLALGAVVQQSPGVLAAIAVSYRFFGPEQEKGQRAGEVIERLARVRKARGLGETVEVKSIAGMPEALGTIERGEATPAEAMQEVMNRVASATGLAVRGLVWETNDLDVIEFPDEVLRHFGRLLLGAGVTVYRPPGAAWGQYAVIFVVIDVAEDGEV